MFILLKCRAALKKSFWGLFLVIILSCVTVKSYEESLRKYEGKKLEDLKSNWGEPTQQMDLSNGNKMIIYLSKSDLEVHCRTSFLLDSHDNIMSWKWEGPRCRP